MTAYSDSLEARFVELRITELRENPVQGLFDVAHLKEVNRRLFQDLPQYIPHKYNPGQFRRGPDSGADWIKPRKLHSLNIISHICYSRMDRFALEYLDSALGAIDIPAYSTMAVDEFTEEIALVYVNLDYVHSFDDGNSRTLREFTQQIAKESGFHIDWAQFNTDQYARDLLYVARDLSVNDIAKGYALKENTLNVIAFSERCLGGMMHLPDLMKGAVTKRTTNNPGPS